jgi:plastocyanin
MEAESTMTHSWFRGVSLAVLAGALVFTAACKDANNNTATTGGASTPAATSQTAPTTVAPTAAATASGATPALGGGGSAAQTVTEVTTDDKFSVTAISAKVGQPLTINVQNKGQAIHNWALSDDAGKAAATGTTAGQLVQPGKTDTINLTFTKAGTFNFNCQVHPTEMTGKVTVTQ